MCAKNDTNGSVYNNQVPVNSLACDDQNAQLTMQVHAVNFPQQSYMEESSVVRKNSIIAHFVITMGILWIDVTRSMAIPLILSLKEDQEAMLSIQGWFCSFFFCRKCEY